MNEQIDEMAKCCTFYHNGECCLDVTNICDCDLMCEMFGVFANLEAQGYRKQSEGEWVKVMNHRECSECRYNAPYKKIKAGYHLQDLSKYCPNCGAKMKGEETPKNIFSPEEVRNMSPREVRDNYGAITESMKGW